MYCLERVPTESSFDRAALHVAVFVDLEVLLADRTTLLNDFRVILNQNSQKRKLTAGED